MAAQTQEKSPVLGALPAPVLTPESASTFDHILKQLDDAYRDVKTIEREVRDFMNEYWRHVGHLFEHLVQLEEGRVAVERLPHTDYIPNDARADKSMEEHTRELKRAYYRLLKRIHPDTALTPHPMPATWLKLSQAAYQKGSLYALWQLERRLDEMEDADGASDEAKLIDRLIDRLDALLAQAQHLRTTDEYALYQRAQLASVNGEDWMGEVISSVKTKIAKLRRRQALDRMSALVARYKGLLEAQL